MKTLFLMLLVTPASLVGACSTSSSSSSGPDASCDRYYRALYGNSAKCEGTSLPSSYTDETIGRFRIVCKQALSLPGTSITTADLDACSAQIESLTCGTSIEQATGACTLSKPGTLGDGTACGDDAQCSSTNCDKPTTTTGDGGFTQTTAATCGKCAPSIPEGGACTSSGSTSCIAGTTCVTTGASSGSGTCQKRVYSGIGGPCGTSAERCNSDLKCDSATKKCVARGDTGATCSSGSDCKYELACIKGTCGARLADGASCDTGTASLFSDVCAHGSACSPSTKTCVKVQYVAAGASCDSITTRCLVGSCGAEFGNQTITPGTCPRVIPDGQPCTADAKDATCAEFAKCTNGTCQIPDESVCR